MPTRRPSDPDAKPQSERFIEMARELGCDEDEAAFKAKLGQIARHKRRAMHPPKGTRMESISYKGWRIDLSHFGPGWKALLYRPAAILAETTIPNDRDPGSRTKVINEATTYIDANGP